MQRWLWGTGCALVAAGCLDAPPGSTSPAIDAAPCEGLEPDGCALFTCDDLPSCYRYCADEVNFAEAVDLCDRPGSKVLETETLGELECADAYNLASIWIGLVQSDEAETSSEGWRWRSTQEAPAETFWGEVEPNDGIEPEDGCEQCVIIYNAIGTWADTPCDPRVASVVCEIEPPD